MKDVSNDSPILCKFLKDVTSTIVIFFLWLVVCGWKFCDDGDEKVGLNKINDAKKEGKKKNEQIYV